MKKNKIKLKKEVSHAAMTPRPTFGVWSGSVEDPRHYLGRVLDAADAADAERKALQRWNVKKVIVRELGDREFPKGPNFGFHPSRGTAKENPYWTDWRRRFHAGIHQDQQLVAVMRSQQGQEQVMKKDKSNTKASSEKAAVKAPKAEKAAAAAETTRQNWNGHGMCEIIRFCGKKGFGPEKTGKIIEAMDLEANPATIKIQLRKGRLDENVPEFSKDHRGEFNAIAEDIPNDEPKAKKAAKAKKADGGAAKAKAKKGGTKVKKSSGKKAMRKHSDDAAAAADVQAEADGDVEGDVEVEDEIEEEVEA